MKRILFSLFSVVAVIAWCSPGFAVETDNGAGPFTMSVTGQTQGVALTGQGSGSTLNIGFDVFTNNRLSSGVAVNSLLSAISTDVASESNINFTADSTVYGTIGGATKFLNIVDTSHIIDFVGAVNATSTSVGTGTLDFNSGNSNSTATNFTGDGVISLGSGSTVIGALTTNTDDTGTLDLASGSTLNGAVGGSSHNLKLIDVLGGSNTAGVSATITGAVGTYGVTLGTNTLNINGALTFSTNSVINTTLASASVYGNIVPVGLSNLGTGLSANVSVPTSSFIAPGTLFNIVQSTSGTGSLATVTSLNSLYSFSIVTTPAGQAEIRTDSVPLQQAQNPVVPVLIAIPATPGLTTILTAITGLPNAAAITAAVAQLNPSTAALVAPMVEFQGTRELDNLWLSRLDMCDEYSRFYKDDPSCQEHNPRSGWWAKGFGYFGNQDDRGSYPGYTSVIAGGMVAYDVPLGLGTRAGLGLGYARTAINENDFAAETDIDSYQATAYIGHDQGPWFINGSGSVGWDQYRGRRDIEFPGVDLTAKSGYAGQDFSTYVNTGFHIPVPAKFIVTPLVSLQYSRVNINSYTETGAGDIDLHVKPQGYDFLESGLGAKLERSFDMGGWSFVPDLHFKWLHDFLNPTLAQTAQFTAAGSPSFYTTSVKTSRDTFDAGAGVTFLKCNCGKKTISLGVGYDFLWRNDGYTANQATLRVTINF